MLYRGTTRILGRIYLLTLVLETHFSWLSTRETKNIVFTISNYLKRLSGLPMWAHFVPTVIFLKETYNKYTNMKQVTLMYQFIVLLITFFFYKINTENDIFEKKIALFTAYRLCISEWSIHIHIAFQNNV